MKTESEIKEMYNELAELDNPNEEFIAGQQNALLWVLGEIDGDDQ